mgnify:FL=1
MSKIDLQQERVSQLETLSEIKNYDSFHDDFLDLLEKHSTSTVFKNIDSDHELWDSVLELRNQVAEYINKENFEYIFKKESR